MRRVILAALPLLAGCGITEWQDPPRGLQSVCDDAGARSNIGRVSDVDARPRPECRPAPAPRGAP
ncbi:hypothetical protein AAFN86_14510 [Roseomonas sp. CAU 1739]|uniref:hypothetical protein n=1 Tax=Roseomonas sp. CAU 1739 TaxID=3140364 RepID=UPI00325AAD10